MDSEREAPAAEPVDRASSVVRQDEVSAALCGIPWRHCRRLLELHGVEVLADGPRKWIIRRADWLQFLQKFGPGQPGGAP